MQKLKVAASALLKDKLQVEREVVCLSNADFTEVSAVVIDIEDYRKGGLNKVNATALEIPVFLYLRDEDTTPEELVGHVVGVINDDLTDVFSAVKSMKLPNATKTSSFLLSSVPSPNTYTKESPSLTARDIREAHTSAAIRPAAHSMTFSVKSFSALTFAMLTLRWATF